MNRDDQDPQQRDHPVDPDMDLLTETLYGELRKLAASRMADERQAHTLQPTALVHEAWLRMGGDKQPVWANRAQFFSSAAKVMRRILIDRARRRNALRHGGGMHRVEMDALNWDGVDAAAAEANDGSLLALNEALTKLAQTDPETAELVEMVYFAGAKIADVAGVLGLSPRTAERRLAYARAWLSQELDPSGDR
jgi:RNA polymerase sigma factor (TIGR02999 family)